MWLAHQALGGPVPADVDDVAAGAGREVVPGSQAWGRFVGRPVEAKVGAALGVADPQVGEDLHRVRRGFRRSGILRLGEIAAGGHALQDPHAVGAAEQIAGPLGPSLERHPHEPPRFGQLQRLIGQLDRLVGAEASSASPSGVWSTSSTVSRCLAPATPRHRASRCTS